MVLTKSQLIKRIKNEELKFTPELDGFQLQPHAIDLRLGTDFYLAKTWRMTEKGREAIKIDPFEKGSLDNFEKIQLKAGQFFELLPKEYIIGTTLEKVEFNSTDLMGILFPRSSINRRGLAVDLSGIIDVGYRGYLMIPIINNTEQQVIKVYPGERICQIVVQHLTDKIEKKEALMHGLYPAKYLENDEKFVSSKSDKDEEIKLIKNGSLEKLKRNYKIL